MTELTISTADIAASIQKNLEGFEPGFDPLPTQVLHFLYVV